MEKEETKEETKEEVKEEAKEEVKKEAKEEVKKDYKLRKKNAAMAVAIFITLAALFFVSTVFDIMLEQYAVTGGVTCLMLAGMSWTLFGMPVGVEE